ncbi:MAG: CapA family protein [Actinomycetota bacterium]|nr:CapA family protein [Actinomycetota bacterium]
MAPLPLTLLLASVVALHSMLPSLFPGGGGQIAEAADRGSAPAHGKDDPASEGRSVTIGWVGDTMLGRAGALPPGEARGLLTEVGRITVDPDVMIGNLEGTLSVGGVSKCGGAGGGNCHAFQVPPSHAGALHAAGFDVMSLANNHALDFGEDGRAQTIAALDEWKIDHTGLPGQVTVVERDGVKMAVLGFAPYPWAAPLTDLQAAGDLVRAAAQAADVVVVTMHAGAEGAGATRTSPGPESAFGENRGDPRAFARAVIDAGADLVLGAGPHVLRGMERYRDRLIAYSLGNFAGFHNFATSGSLALSGILRVSLNEDGTLRSGRFSSLMLDGAGAPRPDPSDAAARMVSELSAADFGPAGVTVSETGRLRFDVD